MEKPRILIVDDEMDLCEIVQFNLQTNGYEAEVAYSAEAVLATDVKRFDLILLDVMLPRMQGFELAQLLSKNPETHHIPIIFLTALDTEDDMIKGFDIGADDYIAKPFSMRELLARVKAVLNRTHNSDTTDITGHNGLRLNEASKMAIIDDTPVRLTRIEFGLLHTLISNRNEVFTRQRLIKEVWPENVIVTERTVDVNITRLRKKLMHYGKHIVTRQGYGYCYETLQETE